MTQAGLIEFGGNHALAISHAVAVLSAKKLFRILIHVVMNSAAPLEKAERIRSMSANLTLIQDGGMGECRRIAGEMAREKGAIMIPPSDQFDIVAGQGTSALELANQAGEQGVHLDAVVLPCGGGSLLAAAAVCFRGLGTKVFGAEPCLGGPRLGESILLEKRLEADYRESTVADGLRSSIGKNNWKILSDTTYLESSFSVSDQEDRRALSVFFTLFGY